MLKKLQVTFCILAGVGIVVFAVAMLTNAQVKTFDKVPEWLAQVAWGSFGLMVACCLGVVVTICLDMRERPEPAEEPVEEVAPAEELEPVAVGAETEEAAFEGEAASEEAAAMEEPATETHEAHAEEPDFEMPHLGDEPAEIDDPFA